MNRTQFQGNSSSERDTKRSSKCTGSIDTYSCADLSSRERIAHQWKEKRSLETQKKVQYAKNRREPPKIRSDTHAQHHTSTPDAGSSSDRTLLDLLLEASTNVWSIESDFMLEARNLILSNARGQDMQMRGAAHQCLRTLITDRSAKPPIRFIDRISWAQFHGMLTQAQAEHLQTLRHKECVHCTDQENVDCDRSCDKREGSMNSCMKLEATANRSAHAYRKEEEQLQSWSTKRSQKMHLPAMCRFCEMLRCAGAAHECRR